MARLGMLSPSTRGEGSEGVQALTSDCDPHSPLPPSAPDSKDPAQLGLAGHSHGEPLWPENTKVPAPATSPSSGHWGRPDTGSNSDCTTSWTCDLEQII